MRRIRAGEVITKEGKHAESKTHGDTLEELRKPQNKTVKLQIC